MADAKTVTAVLLAITTLLAAGYIITDKTYYCVDSKVTAECNSLSQYYSLPNGKCLGVTNKLCKTGWERVDDYLVKPANQTQVNLTSGDYLCDNQKPVSECKASDGRIILRIKNGRN